MKGKGQVMQFGRFLMWLCCMAGLTFSPLIQSFAGESVETDLVEEGEAVHIPFADEAIHKDQNQSPPFDPGKVIIDHVLDSYDWHLFDIGEKEISIPLPLILLYEGRLFVFLSSRFHHGHADYKGFFIVDDGPRKGRVMRVLEDGRTPDPEASAIYDFSITKNVLSVFIASTLLCLLFIRISKSYRDSSHLSTPGGLPLFFEPLVLFVRDQIAVLAIGPDRYQRFMPYLLTVFFFILLNNLLGLLPIFPGGANVTGNISVTFVLAMFTFVATHYYANKHYWQHLFNMPGVPVFLKIPIPIMPLIEVVGALIKPFTLMIRLFANITAGHMVILSLTSLVFLLGTESIFLGYAISPLTVLFLVFLNFLKVLVSFLQAYIFTLFSAFFFGMAVPTGDH